MKRHYKEYAEFCCEEADIPKSKHAHIVEAAQRPLQELMIKVLVAVNAPISEEEGLSALQTFIVSETYKEFIKAPVDIIMLDPKLSGFKLGFTSRLLHHIRVNPGQYHIPHRLIPFLTTKVFATAISRSIIASRAEIKRKLKELFHKKANIYALVKKLVGNLKSQVTVTEDHWYRWAWVHNAYIRFENLNLHQKTFWNWVNNELSLHRQSVKNMPKPARSKALKGMFKQAFDKHLNAYPPSKRLTASTQRETLWQTNATHSISAMEEYDLHDIPNDIDEEDEE
ncbi:hypothetical protein HETIRDRAFT_414181 [Heterobasidion irregulare TC 32-1]|uniref:Uncharacterized protein n=1 Tax=Heterobasidion irregulare (strain TC 32-1) TaxID=747525 RepID=W4KGQ8_HETIT|nr:uncharacterized protein HETIRDRAFT_414181 [Heterobasidion irregulare TC 32-1]ETW85043.1 hypothetical protein HETIRDRAFT_414181 [Heterobasidion irregulare TC 32-1]